MREYTLNDMGHIEQLSSYLHINRYCGKASKTFKNVWITDFGKVFTIEPNDINIVAWPSEKNMKS